MYKIGGGFETVENTFLMYGNPKQKQM